MRGQVVYDLSDFYERFFSKVPLFYLRHSWFVLNRGFLILENPISRRLKTVMDKTLALLFLVPGIPLMGLAALLVFLESGGPVLFRQERTGFRQRTFMVLKIRTMVKDAEKDGAKWASAGDSRITRIGRFLRVTRLDELPQLFNILRGDMSFIGPRPERPVFDEMLEKEIPFYTLRHVIQPGLTGWAQVLYPYGASIEDAWQKFEYDLYYIKNYTPLLDISILIKTVRVVLFGRGR
jgi:lipopolysaccharide/colanic/teichoic acid biosynthesis glycosyltransferase